MENQLMNDFLFSQILILFDKTAFLLLWNILLTGAIVILYIQKE